VYIQPDMYITNECLAGSPEPPTEAKLQSGIRLASDHVKGEEEEIAKIYIL
jgi:hypothetical protein